MRKLASEPEPDQFACVFIPADRARASPAMREYIEGGMVDMMMPIPTSSPMVPYFVGELLQCDAPVEIAKFYDREADVCDWYYQAYSSGGQGGSNSVANILRSPRFPIIAGDVLVLKNGPLNGTWKWSPDISVQALARTLWWYQQSGRDITAVFGERGLMRILGEVV